VREGRRREFAHYPEFADPEAQRHIPDPNAEATFAAARLDWSEPREPEHASWLERYRKLLTIRHREIVPRLDGIMPGGEYELLGQTALRVTWRLGDGTGLVLLANFADAPSAMPKFVSDGRLLYSSGEPPGDAMPPQCAMFYLLMPQ
jgi:1,4-alpha-glucan branching enzyme